MPKSNQDDAKEWAELYQEYKSKKQVEEANKGNILNNEREEFAKMWLAAGQVIFDKSGNENFRLTGGVDFNTKNFIDKILDVERL